jgi:retron-type reverse transcriptase
MSKELLTKHPLNRWKMQRAIMVSVQLYTINTWIDFMLRSRSVFVDIRRVSVHMSVRRGCPQGGILSPLLWNMVTDSLLNWLGNCNCFVQDFADDVVILISGKFLTTICD